MMPTRAVYLESAARWRSRPDPRGSRRAIASRNGDCMAPTRSRPTASKIPHHRHPSLATSLDGHCKSDLYTRPVAVSL